VSWFRQSSLSCLFPKGNSKQRVVWINFLSYVKYVPILPDNIFSKRTRPSPLLRNFT
jgi:hypothetical protein